MENAANENTQQEELKKTDQQPTRDLPNPHNGEEDDNTYTEEEVQFADGEGTDLAESFDEEDELEEDQEA
ncbi:MAG: hypothetical protein EOO42_02565 [Flavobacteriales bacterium]|nr:MAG: hypothetical protein EOO42_02565 [Flavobacteriales bacterium]